MKTSEIKNELDEIIEWEEKIKRDNLKHKPSKCTNYFQQFKTVRSASESISCGKITIKEAKEDQSNLLDKIKKFNNKSLPKIKEGTMKIINTFDNVNTLYEGRDY